MSTPAGDLNPALWAQSVRRSADGALVVAGIDVGRLRAEFGTPAYILDEADFRSRASSFKAAFNDAFVGLCGGADVYYAGKAFLCTAVARMVHEQGLRLDVCSGGELAVAARAGVPGELIGMHGNNKSVPEIEAALDHGVARIVVDSFEEIERVAAAAAARGAVAGVMLRAKTGVEAHSHEFVATAHEDQKFGFSLVGGQLADAVSRVLAHPTSLRLLGLHSHIGSQIFDVAGFETAAERLVAQVVAVAVEHGVRLPELDLGGGFGIAYLDTDRPLPPVQLAKGLAAAVERACSGAGISVPRISVEPGRAIAGPSTFTLYEVGTVKAVALDDGGTRTYVSVDGGMSDNVRPALYGAEYSCVVAGRCSGAEPVLCRVVGKHCESGDILVREAWLPGDVHAGDLLAIPGTGAYCWSLSSRYNHQPRPPVVAVTGDGPGGAGRARAIVRRESLADLLALDQP